MASSGGAACGATAAAGAGAAGGAACGAAAAAGAGAAGGAATAPASGAAGGKAAAAAMILLYWPYSKMTMSLDDPHFEHQQASGLSIKLSIQFLPHLPHRKSILMPRRMSNIGCPTNGATDGATGPAGDIDCAAVSSSPSPIADVADIDCVGVSSFPAPVAGEENADADMDCAAVSS